MNTFLETLKTPRFLTSPIKRDFQANVEVMNAENGHFEGRSCTVNYETSQVRGNVKEALKLRDLGFP